jgi:hypothetical protein
MTRAHLNGSVSLRSASEVFRLVAEILGEQIGRVPPCRRNERVTSVLRASHEHAGRSRSTSPVTRNSSR